MPKQSRWQTQHKGCQAAVDNLKADLTAEIERLTTLLDQSITFTCVECGEFFDEPIRAFVDAPASLRLAPTLCQGCGHEEDD